MTVSNSIELNFAITGSFLSIVCSVCKKEIGVIHIPEYPVQPDLPEFSCIECSETFYETKAINCYLCGKRLQMNYRRIGRGPSSRDICADHLDGKKMIREKDFTENYNRFKEKFGESLHCSYCKNVFTVNNFAELDSARYSRTKVHSYLSDSSGIFCCPNCHQLIQENKTKICLQCGKETDGDIYCSEKCRYAENS